jgi:hypothetical protein
MIKANFHDERDLLKSASKGGQAKQANQALIPYYQRCGYNDFCQWLVKRHGADYLRRPDGEPLDGVPDSAFVLPVEKPVPVNPRQLPPNIYTGNADSDMRLDKPHPQAEVIKRRQPGSVLRAMVLAAVRVRPMTLAEICTHTGLRNQAVKNVLFRYRGTYFRNNHHYWSEAQNMAGGDHGIQAPHAPEGVRMET